MNQFDLINQLVNDHLSAKPAGVGGAEAKPLTLAEEPMTTGEEREIQEAALEGLTRNIERAVAIIALCRAVDRLISAGYPDAAAWLFEQRDNIASSM
jgi:hypothetical protein